MTPNQVKALAYRVANHYAPEGCAERDDIERAARIGIWRLHPTASLPDVRRAAHSHATRAQAGEWWSEATERAVQAEWYKADGRPMETT